MSFFPIPCAASPRSSPTSPRARNLPPRAQSSCACVTISLALPLTAPSSPTSSHAASRISRRIAPSSPTRSADGWAARTRWRREAARWKEARAEDDIGACSSSASKFVVEDTPGPPAAAGARIRQFCDKSDRTCAESCSSASGMGHGTTCAGSTTSSPRATSTTSRRSTGNAKRVSPAPPPLPQAQRQSSLRRGASNVGVATAPRDDQGLSSRRVLKYDSTKPSAAATTSW